MTDESDESDEELLQRLLPGSSTFRPKVLCPTCGWHFPRGMTDPSGQCKELQPDSGTICGQCLTVIHIDANMQPQVMTLETLRAADPEFQNKLRKLWMLTYVAKVLGPKDEPPKGPVQ